MSFKQVVEFDIDDSGDLWLHLDGKILGVIDVCLNLSSKTANTSIIGTNLRAWAARQEREQDLKNGVIRVQYAESPHCCESDHPESTMQAKAIPSVNMSTKLIISNLPAKTHRMSFLQCSHCQKWWAVEDR